MPVDENSRGTVALSAVSSRHHNGISSRRVWFDFHAELAEMFNKPFCAGQNIIAMGRLARNAGEANQGFQLLERLTAMTCQIFLNFSQARGTITNVYSQVSLIEWLLRHAVLY